MTYTSTQIALPASAITSEDICLSQRVSADGTLYYHAIGKDEDTGHTVEKIYDQCKRLVRLVKFSNGGRCEIDFDPQSSRRRRICESGTMPDGNTLSSETVFFDAERSSQVVTIISPGGQLVRIIERQFTGSHITYQGQTEYSVDGLPTITINQHLEQATSVLVHREQIHWYREGQRAMTEHLYFGGSGQLLRYVKLIHYAAAGPFSEETQEFDAVSGKIVRRQLISFSADGRETSIDTLYYDAYGAIRVRDSVFFDELGRPIASRHHDQAEGEFLCQTEPEQAA